jgi:hypothetical protein
MYNTTVLIANDQTMLRDIDDLLDEPEKQGDEK